MSIRAGVVVPVSFHEVDCSPDTKTCAKSDNKSLKYTNCAVKKCHKFFLLDLCLSAMHVFDTLLSRL